MNEDIESISDYFENQEFYDSESKRLAMESILQMNFSDEIVLPEKLSKSDLGGLLRGMYRFVILNAKQFDYPESSVYVTNVVKKFSLKALESYYRDLFWQLAQEGKLNQNVEPIKFHNPSEIPIDNLFYVYRNDKELSVSGSGDLKTSLSLFLYWLYQAELSSNTDDKFNFVALAMLTRLLPEIQESKKEILQTKKARSEFGKKAHLEDYAIKNEVREYWLKNIDKNLANDKAAKILLSFAPMQFRTLSLWVSQFKKEINRSGG